MEKIIAINLLKATSVMFGTNIKLTFIYKEVEYRIDVAPTADEARLGVKYYTDLIEKSNLSNMVNILMYVKYQMISKAGSCPEQKSIIVRNLMEIYDNAINDIKNILNSKPSNIEYIEKIEEENNNLKKKIKDIEKLLGRTEL